MIDSHIELRRVDFSNAQDLAQYLAMLDAYALDPMGAGQRLPADVLRRLAVDLPLLTGAHALLATHQGAAVGFTTCLLGYSTFRARQLLNIHDIAVLPEWRGQGVAHALLGGIEKLAASLGCCAITLEVREDNPTARALYQRFGFTPATSGLNMEKAL